MNLFAGGLLSDPLVQRVGWALVHFLWQGTAVALALAAVLQLVPRRRPQARWAVACAALGLMAVLPFVTACMVSADFPAGRAAGVSRVAGVPAVGGEPAGSQPSVPPTQVPVEGPLVTAAAPSAGLAGAGPGVGSGGSWSGSAIG